MDEQQILQAHPDELRQLTDGAIPVTVAINKLDQFGSLVGIDNTSAILSWSRDGNFVKLASVDSTENEISTIFLVTPDQVEGADFSFNMYTLFVSGTKYVMYVRSTAKEKVHAASIAKNLLHGAGHIAAGSVQKGQGNVTDLQELLTKSDVETTSPSLLKLLFWTVAGCVAILIVLMLSLTLLSS